MSRIFTFFSIGVLACALLAASSFAGIAENVQRASVAGIQLHTYRTSIEEVVVISGWFPAGDTFCTDTNPALASLTASMLDQGTTKQGKFELAKKLEEIGASIGFSAESQVVSFSARCLKPDLPVVIALLAEQLRFPAFSAGEFSKLQNRLTGSLQRQFEDTGTRAAIAFARSIYPAGHPNRPADLNELLAGVGSAKVEDLRAFHAAHYGPAHLTMVAVGDVDLDLLRSELEKNFSGWSGGTPLPRVQPAAAPVVVTQLDQTVFVPGKTSVNVLWGQASGLRHRDVDSLALRAATAVFGSGFTGRLSANVRDKEGLTYGVGAGLDDDTYADGHWAINATFAPELLGKGVASIKRQLDRWYAEGVTEAELTAKKQNLIGRFQVGLATTEGIARAISANLQRGRPLAWLDQYPQAVAALTREQVNKAVKAHLDPERMVLIKAGTVGSPES